MPLREMPWPSIESELEFRTLDVFTDRTFGGNPLGVFPDAAHLPTDLMQSIAREMNLAETVFLGPPETPAGTARVRIFTPRVEVPFAGHPTVGTAIHLAAGDALRAQAGLDADGNGRINVLLEENVGPVPVAVRYAGGRPAFARFATAVLPERRESPHALGRLAEMVGLEEGDLGGSAPAAGQAVAPSGARDSLAPAMMSCGLPFHVIPVRSAAALGRAVLNMAVWQELLADSWAHHVYLVCPTSGGAGGSDRDAGAGGRGGAGAGDGGVGEVDVRVRMFAPGSGVPEDPATGSAAAVLGGYLGDASGRDRGTLRWRVAQGAEIGRPSLIEVECDRVDGATSAVRVGGGAVFVSRGTMSVPG